MIKYIILILLIFPFLITRSQLPSGFPTQANTGWTQWGYQQSTKATIIANSDTNWTPRYPFTIIGWAHAGVDSAYWMWDGVHWKKLSSFNDIKWGNIAGTLSNQTDLQNAINLKFNISDTTNKWVQNVYQRNDSLFKFKNNTETFIHTFSPPITANNALTETSNNIQLGGALIQPTNIISAIGANRIIYSGVSGFGDGAQLDVSTTGSVGIGVRGQTNDGRGIFGLATTGVGV